MAKKKKRKSNKKTSVAKVNIQELQESRDGGQIALKGYSYQFLYSCNLILSADANTTFTLEGIEDIDSVKYSDDSKIITHIQLKYSTQRQDASFMDSVLKNYLEAYLMIIITQVIPGTVLYMTGSLARYRNVWSHISRKDPTWIVKMAR